MPVGTAVEEATRSDRKLDLCHSGRREEERERGKEGGGRESIQKYDTVRVFT